MSDSSKFRICINAAGCLPDSETYPYEVEGLDAAIDALRAEVDLSTPEDIPEAKVEEEVATAIHELSASGYVGFSLPGTYRLTVELVV